MRQRGEQSLSAALNQCEAALKIAGKIGIGHLLGVRFHVPLRQRVQKQSQLGFRIWRAQSACGGEIFSIHGENQIESRKIRKGDLPRPQIRQIIAPCKGGALHRAVRCLTDVPIARACAIKGERYPARGSALARDRFSGGGAADIAKAKHENMCHARRIRAKIWQGKAGEE